MKMVMLTVVLLVTVCLTGSVWAYDFTLTVGQSRSFTEFNVHDSWFVDDPGNPLPWPADRIADAAGNYANVSLAASPGQAGMAYAQTGLQYDLQMGRYTWEEARGWPLKITIQFSYSIYAQWTLGTGSGNAWLHLPNGVLHDYLGWETQETGGRNNSVTYSWDTTLEEIQTRWGGPVLVFETGCQAHTAEGTGTSNSSLSEVIIDFIQVEFLPRSVDLSGEYWFGSLSADVNTNVPWGKRGSLVVSGGNWSQEWDDYNGHQTFSSPFTATIQPDGSVNVNFPSETYNVAWNGDMMLHANNVADSNNRLGLDIFVRKAAGVQSSNVAGEYRYFGHWLNWEDRWDSAGWGDLVIDPNGTAFIAGVEDDREPFSNVDSWTLDAANALVEVDDGLQFAIGAGGLMMRFWPEPVGAHPEYGYNFCVPKSDETITLAEMAGHYQTRFIESGPGGVPYTCGQGTGVIDAVTGVLSLDAWFSNGEHDTGSTECSVGPGNEFHLDDDSVPDGIISPDKNLIFIPEYRYENPPTRENYDWLGGIFLIRTPEVEHNDPSGRLFWYAAKSVYPSGVGYAIVIRLDISGTKACSFKGPQMADYTPAAWDPGLDNWLWELRPLTLAALQQESQGTWELKLTHNDDRETVYSFTISGALEENEFLPIPEIIEPVQEASNVIAQHYNLSWNPNGAQAGADDLYVEIGGDNFNYFSNIIDDAVEWRPGWLELGEAYCKVGYVDYRPEMMDGPTLVSGPVIDWSIRTASLVSGDKHYMTVKYSLDFIDDDRIDLSDLAVFCSHWLETSSDNWTWVSGSNIPNQPAVYGVKGIASSDNVPGVKIGSVAWTDSEDNLWLFGGRGYNASGQWCSWNDLWKYNPSSGFWTWVSGSNIGNQNGNYGTKGIALPDNVPGSRDDAVTWIDSEDRLWLFGGYANLANGYLNDLWMFDGTYWTWVSGSDSVDQYSIYGTKNIATSDNMPGGRVYSISWIDRSGDLWFFGGQGYDTNGSIGLFNDLWKYNPSSGLWIWVSGSNTAGQEGIYGTKGVAAADNIPGARRQCICWIDSSDNLWLFGGWGYDASGNIRCLNDLWKYNPSSGLWTWVSGSNIGNQYGVYGNKGVSAPDQVPGARNGSISWIVSDANLWLWGGTGYSESDQGYLNDLWKYDPSSGLWTWISGPNAGNQNGVYGTQRVADPNNMPLGRSGGVSWVDSSKNLWLFGGIGYDASGTNFWSYLNDLWTYGKSGNLVADFDDDGSVNLGDYAIFAQHWLEDVNALADHVFQIEISMDWDYENPDLTTDLTHDFEVEILTDDTVDRIAFTTPAGNTFVIPNTPPTEYAFAGGWMEYGREYDVESGRYEWYYGPSFDSPDALLEYGDGLYTFTVYFVGGRVQQTTAWFGIPGTGDPIPQPTQEPALTSFSNGDTVVSPVTFAWESCTDPAATIIWLGVQIYSEPEELQGEQDFYFAVGATGLPQPLVLDPEMWEAELGFEVWYFSQNSDGIEIGAGKSSESDYVLTVSGSVADLNGSGAVDDDDLVIMATQWLQAPGNPSADIAPRPAGDGIVNLADFALLADQWLEGI